MNKQQTQIKQIENHLLTFGSITSWRAITKYHITRLSSYIHTLRDRGWNIDSTWKNNSDTRWTEYKLVKYPNS